MRLVGVFANTPVHRTVDIIETDATALLLKERKLFGVKLISVIVMASVGRLCMVAAYWTTSSLGFNGWKRQNRSPPGFCFVF